MDSVKKIGDETPVFGVAQMVGFGLGRPKMLNLARRIS
jgi:hypothetical protein